VFVLIISALGLVPQNVRLLGLEILVRERQSGQ
jgi:hypothetical protein